MLAVCTDASQLSHNNANRKEQIDDTCYIQFYCYSSVLSCQSVQQFLVSVKHALFLDKFIGNNQWAEVIKKELEQFNEVETARVLGEGESVEQF